MHFCFKFLQLSWLEYISASNFWS